MRWSRVLASLFGCALCVVAGTAGAELITNGDFSLGGVGFGSDYQFASSNKNGGVVQGTLAKAGWCKWTCKSISTASAGTGLADEGQFSVTPAVNAWNSNFVTPHSAQLPVGNTMLVANGSGDSWNRVWYQNISVVAGKTYDVSFSAASLFPDNPAILRFFAGLDPSDPFAVQNVATIALAGATGADAWLTGTGQFTATHSGSVRMFISDMITAATGNDFAIDNISVVEAVPEPCSLMLLGIGSVIGLGVCRRRRQAKN